MRFQEVWDYVRGYKYSCKEHCRKMYDLILENEYESCLELGVAYGKMTCIMAAAMEEVFGGGGYEMHAVDLARMRTRWKDSVQRNLKELGLHADIWYEDISYTWRLMKFIEQQTEYDDELEIELCVPKYDLIFIDGAHNVYEDAGAFFLADKLLKSGGRMVFDDLPWTHQGAMDGQVVWGRNILEMSPEEREAKHVGMIWEYLVKQHPSYDIEYQDDWFAYAKKIHEDEDIHAASRWGEIYSA